MPAPAFLALSVLLAGVGTGALALQLGRARGGALLAAAGYGFSCAGVLELGGLLPDGTLWLGALLPWVLLAAERSGAGAAPGPRVGRAAIAGGLALLATARAGARAAPPLALAGLVWSLARERAERGRHAPAAIAVLVGVALGALRAGLPAGAAARGPAVDLVALGILVLLAGMVVRWRELAPRLGPRSWIVGAVVFALLALGGLVVLGRRGLSRPALDLVLPMTAGASAPWIPAALAVPAVVALFGGGAPARGEQTLVSAPADGARRGALAGLGGLALALLVEAPGAAGLGATLLGPLYRPAAWLPLATLVLALAAANGALASARARIAGAATALALALLAAHGLAEPTRGRVDPPDELVAVLAPDPPRLERGARLVGRISAAVPAERVRLELGRVDRDGRPLASDTLRVDADWLTAQAAEAERAVQGVPSDARLFAVTVPRATGLREVRLVVEGAGGERLGERALGRVGRDASLLPWILAALALCLPWPRPRTLLLVLLVVLQPGARTLVLWPA